MADAYDATITCDRHRSRIELVKSIREEWEQAFIETIAAGIEKNENRCAESFDRWIRLHRKAHHLECLLNDAETALNQAKKQAKGKGKKSTV